MRSLVRPIQLALATAISLVALSLMPISASAQTYPVRPIRLIVGFPPGGINDLVARIVGQSVSESLGQPIVIENRPGAGGTIGANAVAKADPDGYTLLLASVSNLAMAPSQYKSLAYDPMKDFAPVALVAASPNIMVVPNDSPIRSVLDLIALAKKQPGSMNYASAGNGTSNHLTVELLKAKAGIDLVHVPYRGDAPGMTDVLAGRIQMMFPTLPVALPQIKAGALRAIAVSSPKRSELVPDIPTVAESGSLPEFSVSVWVGILAPAGTSPEIVSKLNAEIHKALASSVVREQLAAQGTEPAAAADPKTFGLYLASETKKWSEVAKAAGITPN
jgi:tripartite-type tricarboxylate transporter receptor subunit TctC